MQKSPLCKIELRGDNCGCNFNKFNTCIKAYTSSICIGESSNQGAQLKDAKASKRTSCKQEVNQYRALNQEDLDIQTLISKGFHATILG